MPKENCKYWDKCYQKNPTHIEKYNHPKKMETKETEKESPKKDCKKLTSKPKASEMEKYSSESEKHSSASDKKEQFSTCQSERNSSTFESEKNSPTSEAEKNSSTSEAERNSSTTETEEHSSTSVTKGRRSTEEDKPKYDTEDLKKEALANISGKDYLKKIQNRIKVSEKEEYNNLLKSNEFLRHKFLMEMPPDFFAFWKFIEEFKKDLKGEDLLSYMDKSFQLLLVGPFEFLAGKFHNAELQEPGDYLRHWRFYYDPPEFQTVFVHKGTGIHYGYWRDNPHDKENLLVARNDAAFDNKFIFVAGNVFDAFSYYLEHDFKGTPFTASKVNTIKKYLKKHIESMDVKLESFEKLQNKRRTKVVCKTFHRAGIVVPFDTKTKVGYRPLIKSDAQLKDILDSLKLSISTEDKDDPITVSVLEKLQPIATAATIAVDESDFGTALELGIDLFSSGYPQLHKLALSLSVSAYSLLHRPQFVAIIKAHLECRAKTLNLSMFDSDT